MTTTRRIGLVLGLIVMVCVEANAGNDGFFTTYTSNVEHGEVEIMLMGDYTRPSRPRRDADGLGDYASQMLEIEYGVSDRIAAEVMVEGFGDADTGASAFTGARYEARYRIFRDTVPLNPMVYVEFEDLDARTRYKMEVSGWVEPPYIETGDEPGHERILETRLVLSQDLGPLRLAANWINESDLLEGGSAFGYALGAVRSGHGGHEASCPCARSMAGCHCGHCAGRGDPCDCGHAGSVGLGIEFFGALGDTEEMSLRTSRQEHYAGPLAVYHVDGHWMVHTQAAVGLTAASDDLFRLNVGYEF